MKKHLMLAVSLLASLPAHAITLEEAHAGFSHLYGPNVDATTQLLIDTHCNAMVQQTGFYSDNVIFMTQFKQFLVDLIRSGQAISNSENPQEVAEDLAELITFVLANNKGKAWEDCTPQDFEVGIFNNWDYATLSVVFVRANAHARAATRSLSLLTIFTQRTTLLGYIAAIRTGIQLVKTGADVADRIVILLENTIKDPSTLGTLLSALTQQRSARRSLS